MATYIWTRTTKEMIAKALENAAATGNKECSTVGTEELRSIRCVQERQVHLYTIHFHVGSRFNTALSFYAHVCLYFTQCHQATSTCLLQRILFHNTKIASHVSHYNVPCVLRQWCCCTVRSYCPSKFIGIYAVHTPFLNTHSSNVCLLKDALFLYGAYPFLFREL